MAKNKRVRAESQSILQTVRAGVNQFRVIGPVYLTSAGLAFAYGWGWLSTYGIVFGGALAAFAATCELILPVIGDRIEEARRKHKVFALLAVGVAVLSFGVLSGVVAYNAAEAPTAAYNAGQAAIQAAEADVRAARRDLAAFACTADMPASRCEVMRAENAGAEARATAVLADAEAALNRAKEAAAPAPVVQVPNVPVAVKIGLGLAIDFILIIFPWAARAERDAVAVQPAAAVEPVAKAPEAPVAAKVNDGGWATRRARYGPSGQRPRNVVSLDAHRRA